MPIDWSDEILLANLANEPAMSEELNLIGDKLSAEGATVPHVVLDLQQVAYVNSSNIAQMLRLRKILDGAGRQMRVCGVSDEIWSVMLVTGLEKVFHFAPDIMTALAGLQLEAGPEGD